MDPEQTLLLCDAAILDFELDEAYWYLSAYRDWRSRGGFEPTLHNMLGDAYAAECERRIEAQLGADATHADTR